MSQGTSAKEGGLWESQYVCGLPRLGAPSRAWAVVGEATFGVVGASGATGRGRGQVAGGRRVSGASATLSVAAGAGGPPEESDGVCQTGPVSLCVTAGSLGQRVPTILTANIAAPQCSSKVRRLCGVWKLIYGAVVCAVQVPTEEPRCVWGSSNHTMRKRK